MRAALLFTAFLGLIAPSAVGQTYRDLYRAGAMEAAADRQEEAYVLFARAAEGAYAARDLAVELRARRVLAQVDFNRGARLAWQGFPAEAIPYFEASLANDPEKPLPLLGLGDALLGAGRRDDAVLAFVRARDAAFRVADDTLRRRADFSVREAFLAPVRPRFSGPALGTAESAIDALTRLNALDAYAEPDATSFLYRANALLVLRRLPQALAAADTGLAQYRGSRAGAAGLNFARGEILLALGRRDGAIQPFERALYEGYRERALVRLREITGR